VAGINEDSEAVSKLTVTACGSNSVTRINPFKLEAIIQFRFEKAITQTACPDRCANGQFPTACEKGANDRREIRASQESGRKAKQWVISKNAFAERRSKNGT
jgi:hypothetical protein